MDYKAPYGSVDPDAPYVDKDVPGAVAGSKVPRQAIQGPMTEIANVIDYFLGNGTWRSGQNAADLTQLKQIMQRLPITSRADLAVNGWQATPPGSPVKGDQYVIATGATGAWAGLALYVALWTGTAWVFAAPTPGLVATYMVGSQLKAIYYNSGAWQEWTASTTLFGPARLATIAEAVAKVLATVAVTPAGLAEVLRTNELPIISAFEASTGTYVGSTVQTKVSYLDTINKNSLGAAGSWVSSRLTVTTAGAGLWLAQGSVSVPFCGPNASVSIFRNGGEVLFGSQPEGNVGDASVPTTSGFVQMNAGDYLELFVYQQTGSAKYLNTGNRTRFDAARISA